MSEGLIKTMSFCIVKVVGDDYNTDSIKVVLRPEDNGKTMSMIPWAFPLLPKMFRVMPKVGEGVLVFTMIANDGNSKRFYIGPIISQDDKMFNENFKYGAEKVFFGGPTMSKIKQVDGVYPNKEDILIRGRKNSDIVISDDDIRIRAGVKLTNEQNPTEISFNEKNPAYAKFKYSKEPITNNVQSTAAIVADKIALLQADKGDYNLTNRQDLITDEEMKKVIESAYKLPYGEKLVEFLQLFVQCFINHSHPYPMKPPYEHYTNNLNLEKSRLLDNKELLSDTIRIN